MNAPLKPASLPSRRHKVSLAKVNLSHGSGGKAMRDLIDDVFVGAFDNPALAPLEDQARFDLAALAAQGDRLAFTTDSYVIDPLVFPGGDIGTLAVCGTVNDLAVSGAKPLYLSCGAIIEEGFPVEDLRRLAASMRRAADVAGVSIVTGDTKVVQKGAADKLFINTAGVGVIPAGLDIAARRATAGDAILVNGLLGDHGAAILNARGDLALETPVDSDCRPLNGLVDTILAACSEVHCLRDATRGGLATVLNEFAEAAAVGIELEEDRLPIRETVKGFCEILGLDPLYLANEGKLVLVLPEAEAENALAAMRAHPAGREAAVVGRVTEGPTGRVVMNTLFGGQRVVDMLVGDQLPRIC